MAGIGLFLISTALRRLPASVDYSQALSKAKDAAMAQSGLDKDVNNLTLYAHHQAMKYLGEPFVDTTLVTFYVIRWKNVNTKLFESPVIPFAQHSFSLSLSEVKFITVWKF